MDVAFLNINYLLKAALVTLEMAVATVVLSFIVGTALGVAAALSGRLVRSVLTVYVYVVRGVPVLVLIFIAYFGLPRLGVDAPNYVAATIALVIYFAAFVADIVKVQFLPCPRAPWRPDWLSACVGDKSSCRFNFPWDASRAPAIGNHCVHCSEEHFVRLDRGRLGTDVCIA